MRMSPVLMPTERLAATELTTSLPTTRIGAGQWLVLGAALLGWMFDGAEMGLFTAVGRPALQDLAGFSGR